MPLMEWDKNFELGVMAFDEHHKHLVSLINKTYDDMVVGSNREDLEATLDELIDYATYHFAAEEQSMTAQEYPGLAQHCAEHNRFSGRVVEMQKDFHNRNTRITLEVLQFLKNWLTDHILKTEAEYGRFLKELSPGSR